ncbi:hypothetical protein P4O66_004491, partial [Electrophorus voltai]
MGTARREILHISPGFSRASESSPDAARNRGAFQGTGPLSRGEPIPGCPALYKERRELFPGPPLASLGFVCVTALDASRRLSPPLRVRGSEPDSLSIGRRATEAIAPPLPNG